ncbi:hypothetical protein [Succinimonas sp.]
MGWVSGYHIVRFNTATGYHPMRLVVTWLLAPAKKQFQYRSRVTPFAA